MEDDSARQYVSKGFGSQIGMTVYLDATIDNICYLLNLDKRTAEVVENPDKYSGVVIIPESVVFQNETYIVREISDEAFMDCTELQAISIPSSVELIDKQAFSGCQVQLYIENLEAWMNTKISFEIYDEDGPLIDPEYNLPCVANALYVDGNPVKCLEIPNSIQVIKKWQFIGWDFITSFVISESVSKIGYGAFQECSGISEITIPASVTVIDAYAFYKCEGLKSVAIDGGVKDIGANAFGGLKNFCEFYCFVEVVPKTHETAFDDSGIGQYGTLYVPENAIENYRRTIPWCQFKSIVAV